MNGPFYDERGAPLAQSGVSERIWALYHTDRPAFLREIRAYFARGYPGWTPAKVSYNDRIIWIRDDRWRMQ